MGVEVPPRLVRARKWQSLQGCDFLPSAHANSPANHKGAHLLTTIECEQRQFGYYCAALSTPALPLLHPWLPAAVVPWTKPLVSERVNVCLGVFLQRVPPRTHYPKIPATTQFAIFASQHQLSQPPPCLTSSPGMSSVVSVFSKSFG